MLVFWGEMFDKLRCVIDAVRRRPLTVDELAEELGLPKTTAYRYLRFLEECGLAYKGGDKRYRWGEVGSRGSPRYSSRDEYEVLRDHSRELIPGIRAAIYDYSGVSHHLGRLRFVEESGYKIHDGEVLDRVKRCFVEHLRSGYPATYRGVERLERLRPQREECTHSLRKMIVEEASKTLISLNIPTHISERKTPGIYGVEREVSADDKRYCYIRALLDLSIERGRSRLRRYPVPEHEYDAGKGELVFGGQTLARGISGEEADKLAGEVERISTLNEVERRLDELMNLETEIHSLESKLGDELREIEAEVKVGNPLEGSCKVCERLSFPPPKPEPDISIAK